MRDRLFYNRAREPYARKFPELREGRAGFRKTAERPILVEVSAGKLVDKVTIIEIKNGRISDLERLASIGQRAGQARGFPGSGLQPEPSA